ncbi:hypothetical protein F7P69_20890 [Cellulosimicrobium funkei]|nr:hypothetical protein [Cellulosimicrobium funkei]
MSQTVTARTGRVTFEVPDHWTAEDPGRSEVDALAFLAGPQGDFAPNAVLTVNSFTGSVAEFAVSALENITTVLTDAVVIDVLPWEPSSGLADSPSDTGRLIVYTHRSPSTGARLRVAEWLVAGQGLAVQLTTTTSVSQWTVFDSTMWAIAGSLRIDGLEHPSAPAAGGGAIPPPARDEFLTELTGHPVERIHGLASRQPYPNEGGWLHGSAVKLLSELAEGLKIGRLNAGDYAEPLAMLSEVGLVQGTSLTEDGHTLGHFLSQPDVSVRITGHFGGQTPSFQAWTLGGHALIAASTGYIAATEGVNGGQPSHDHFNIQVVNLDRLTTLMAQWVGLQPAWSLPVFPMVLPEDRVDARWAGDGTFPEGASETMQRLWHENWYLWDMLLVSEETEVGPVSYLNGGRMGHYRMATEPLGTQRGFALVPTPAVSIVDQMEDALQSCLYGRQPRMK